MATNHLIGQQINQYRILRHIASGRAAELYLAEDVELHRQAALKIMQAHLAGDEQFLRRFRREARAAAQLEHPGVVQIYSEGTLPDGRPYIAMQYVAGGSLQDKLAELAAREMLLTTEQALNVARQLAEALAAAHQAGIIHRDLKPANVLIHPDGQPVLADLGLALVADGDKLTQTGAVLGTPYYTSPEHIKGLPLDGRSDLYSLGVMLYEMLAGVRPFTAEEPFAALHQHVSEKPPPLDTFRPDLTPATLDLVETALQKEPSRRFPHAAAMIAAIDRALQAEGAAEPNPQATRVLSTLEDALLVSRPIPANAPPPPASIPPPYAPIPTAPPPRRRAPLWVWVTLLAAGAAALFFLLSSPSGGRVDEAAIAAAITQTAAAAPTASVTIPALSQTPRPAAAAVDETAASPTATPSPSLTPEATATFTAAPTDTPPPATATPTPTPTPTPCGLAVYAPFSTAWDAHTDQLRCPTAAGRGSVGLALEDFRNGRMIWREDNRQIYVLYSNGRWAAYTDAWRSGDPEYSCGAPQSPPTPRRGFGKIWCTYESVRAGLGEAVSAEWGATGALQLFTGGFILQPAGEPVYVFYDNGTWR